MIRLVAYNVSGAQDPAALVEVLRGLRPHVACLSEAPGRLALGRLARRSGLHVAERAGRRRWANAVLVGEDVRVLSHVAVELHAPKQVPQRSAAKAIVGVGGIRFAVVSTQFGLRPEVRERNAQELEQLLASVDTPTVLAGDFNESPGGVAAGRFAGLMQDAFARAGEGRGETYPNPDPSARRDLVFVSHDLVVVRCWVPDVPPVSTASHHRPVVVELATPQEEPAPDAQEAAGSAA